MYQVKLIGGPRGGETLEVASIASDLAVAVYDPRTRYVNNFHIAEGTPEVNINYYRYDHSYDGILRMFWIDPNLSAARREQEAKNRADKAEQDLELLRAEFKEALGATASLLEHGYPDAAGDLLCSYLDRFGE